MTRGELHAMIDRLPDASISEAAEALREVVDHGVVAESEARALNEGLAQARRGEGRALSDVLADLQL
jgi:hypothetical protein